MGSGNNGESGYKTVVDRGPSAIVTVKETESGTPNGCTNGLCRVQENANDVERYCDFDSGNAAATDSASGFAICSLIQSASS